MHIPKKKEMDRLEEQRKGICVQSVLAKWYCGCFTILFEMELRNVVRRAKVGTKCILIDLKKAEVQPAGGGCQGVGA